MRAKQSEARLKAKLYWNPIRPDGSISNSKKKKEIGIEEHKHVRS